MRFSWKKWVMLMNKTAKVATFTLKQLIKSKSNRIVLIVLLLAAIVSVPIAVLVTSDKDEAAKPEEIYSYVSTFEDYMDNYSDDFDTRYGVQYGYSLFLMVISLFSAQYIVRAIVEEKSSKLVETLMVSVHSENMIFGKIIAVLVYLSVLVAAIAAAFALSISITGLFADTSFINDIFAKLGISRELLNLGAEILIIIPVSMVLALLLFAQIAAITGAGCSNMEDIEGANTTSMLLILASYMISIMNMSGGKSAVVFSLIPAVSSFSAPVNYILGDIGWGILAASWLIQLALIALIYKFSGKVYDSLIIYNGKRLKLKEILALAGKGAK